jgi:hypothetical protein
LTPGYILELTEAAIKEENIRLDQCFLCAKNASTGQGEHVFPKWMQRRFDLWNQTLNLINGTRIRYKDLTIPCCVECNTVILADIETTISKLDESDLPLSNENTIVTARWLIKLLIGILHKEARLKYDRRDASKGEIFPPELLDGYHHLLTILNTHRKKTLSFDSMHWAFPFSFYTYKIKCEEQEAGFDFSTHLDGRSVSIRLGRFGLIFVGDGGLQMEAGELGPFDLVNHELSPLQFAEISARVHYKSSLRCVSHNYISNETQDKFTMTQKNLANLNDHALPPPTEEGTIIFHNWLESELAQCMETYMGIDASEIYDEASNLCGTTLIDSAGRFKSTTS